jgi:LPS-assembly protein
MSTGRTVWVVLAWLSLTGRVAAQDLAGCNSSTQLSWRLERLGEHHYRRVGAVEIDCGGIKFFADEIDLFTDGNRLVASGNVVFVTPGSRIAAERLEFDTARGTGTFFHASGIAFLAGSAVRSMFGSQEPQAYFYGETLERLGPKKYRITRGAFTTCVQPTPRWEIVSSSVVINLDEYALLKNSVLRVKGVPLFYVPVLYYPLEEDDRATGFLLPSYGASTYRGPSISNAFFWAINRSQDATFFHDWFSRTGQGAGAEYRYVTAPGSGGTIRTYWLAEREIELATGQRVPGRRSYELRGEAVQAFGTHVRARGRVDYFSDVTVQQLYHQNLDDASRRTRVVAGHLLSQWGAYTLSGALEQTEIFFSRTSSALAGARPRVLVTRAERPLWGRAVYGSFAAEYAGLLRQQRDEATVVDLGLTRIDLTPLVRLPLTRWPFLTVNSSVAWRLTRWTESLDPVTRHQVPQSLTRRYFDLQSQVTGPTFVKIWDGALRRYKHVIEPSVTVQRITPIDQFDRIVILEGSDAVVGRMTRIGYGVANRFYTRRRAAGAVAREILNIAVLQSYYTDARAAQFDAWFRTSFSGTPPSHFSPVALIVRAQPTPQMNGTFRAEYDTQFRAFRTLGADAAASAGTWLHVAGGWSQRRFIKGLPGFDDPSRLEHFLNAATTLRTPANRVGGSYAFHYDLTRRQHLQWRLAGYYNAQCCGVAIEYQVVNLATVRAGIAIPRDRRFNFSFTLAGIGTFSNFFGALGGGGPR